MAEIGKRAGEGAGAPYRSADDYQFDAQQSGPHLETPRRPEDCPSLSIAPRQSILVEPVARMSLPSLGRAFFSALDGRIHLGKHFLKREGPLAIGFGLGLLD